MVCLLQYIEFDTKNMFFCWNKEYLPELKVCVLINNVSYNAFKPAIAQINWF